MWSLRLHRRSQREVFEPSETIVADPDGFTDYQWYIHARVMQCPGCEGLIFYTYREWHYEDPADWPVTILYPQPPDVRGLPEKVRELYEKALPTKASDPTSFVVGIGNILEAICAEQGISSNKTLQRKLQDLAAKFPDTLADMTHHLRKLRNRGAHGDMVEASDAKIAARFRGIYPGSPVPKSGEAPTSNSSRIWLDLSYAAPGS